MYREPPGTVTVTPPPLLQKSPFVISFGQPVRGVSTFDLHVYADTGHTQLTGTLTCADAASAAVDCNAGPVSTARFTPSVALVAGEHYTVVENDAFTGIIYTSGWLLIAPSQRVRAQTAFAYNQFPVKYAWGTVPNAAALGGTYVQEQFPGASETYSFTGSSLGLIAWAGPDRGTAAVKITTPGHPAVSQTIDLYAPSAGDATFSWPSLVAGKHTIKITANGASNPPSAGSWVSIDGFSVTAPPSTRP